MSKLSTRSANQEDVHEEISTRIPAMDAEDSAEKLKRKLAVILASDVAGYSRLVSISEGF